MPRYSSGVQCLTFGLDGGLRPGPVVVKKFDGSLSASRMFLSLVVDELDDLMMIFDSFESQILVSVIGN